MSKAAEKATPAAAWRKKPELVELPSGHKAQLREKVNVYAALRAGVLTAQHVADYEATQRGELDDAERAMSLQDALVAWLFVEPRCVIGKAKVPAGAIHIADLDDDDLDVLIERAFGGTSEDATFPDADSVPGDGGVARAGGHGPGLADDPEPDGRDGGGDAPRVPDRPPPRKAPRRASTGGRKRS